MYLGDKTEVCHTSINNETTDISGADTTESLLYDIILSLNQDETCPFLDTVNVSENIKIIEIPHSSDEIFSKSLIEDALIEKPSIQMSSESTSQNIQNDTSSINISNGKLKFGYLLYVYCLKLRFKR